MSDFDDIEKWLNDENDLSGLTGDYEYDDWGIILKSKASVGESLNDWDRESVLRKNTFLAPYGREYYFDTFNPSRFYVNNEPNLPMTVDPFLEEFWNDYLPEVKEETVGLIKDLVDNDRMNRYSLDLVQSQITGHISWVLSRCLNVEFDELDLAKRVTEGCNVVEVFGDFDLEGALTDLPEAAAQMVLKLSARYETVKLLSDRLRDLQDYENYGFVSSLEDFVWRYPEKDLDTALADYYLLISFFTDAPDRFIYEEFKAIPRDKYSFAASFAVDHPFRVQFQQVVDLPARLINVGQRQNGVEPLYYAINSRVDSSRWDDAFAFSMVLDQCMERHDAYYSERGLDGSQADKDLLDFLDSINEKFDAPILRLGSFLMDNPLFLTSKEQKHMDSLAYLQRFYGEIAYVDGADWNNLEANDLLNHPYTKAMGKSFGRRIVGLGHVLNDLDPELVQAVVTQDEQDLSNLGEDGYREYCGFVSHLVDDLLEESQLTIEDDELLLLRGLLTSICYDYAYQNLGLSLSNWQILLAAREVDLRLSLRQYEDKITQAADIKEVLSVNGGASVYINAIESGEISVDDYSPFYVVMAVLESYGVHIPYEVVEMAQKSVMARGL